jgi:hypothetical protein
LLTATGQRGPLRRCAALAALGLSETVVAPVAMYSDHSVSGIGLFLTGAILLLGSAFYALRRTTCPRCKTPWLQYALGEKSINGWLAWLTTFTECPECGLSAKDTASEL